MNNFVLEKTLNMCLKFKKHIEHIRYSLKKVKPSEATICINETDIIFMTTDGHLGRAPYICISKLKWSFDYMTRHRKR
jgi:hypothetical protein